MAGTESLTLRQQELLATWFVDPAVIDDYSWGLIDTFVLHIRDRDRDAIVKASGPTNHHLQREIAGHREWTAPWLETGSIGALLEYDLSASMLAIGYVPGLLVQDVPEAVADPETHRQAGALLAHFHDQASRIDPDYEVSADRKALDWLARDHRIAPDVVRQVRAAMTRHQRLPVEVVPTHGDWQARNWLIDDGEIRVIDLGRFAWRPRWTDFTRLEHREWEGRPDLEAAFLDGYGRDPRDPYHSRATFLREAVGNAVWAYEVGDEEFEQHGHRMIAQALELYPD